MRHGILGLILLLIAVALPAQAATTDEVRVLIDVSGSMKRTDPQNLRAPALRLLVKLLPPDSRAGVWSFAQYVNNIVPVEPVSRQWQDTAVRAADRIHSRGLFTDIGAALQAATRDWQEPDPNTRRSIILLTDGVVDVSKEPGANDQARRRLLEAILPGLRDAGVNVHTIALSAEADSELMRQLALETGASFEQTNSAEELQRLFLRLFEKAVERDSLPLKGNRFNVDGSIKELTLLAFQSADAEPARLVRPDGSQFGPTDAPGNVDWHHEEGYDLVTVRQPQAGEWRLVAEIDPDNRVMIVTDLKLETTALPNNIILGERFPLQAQLTEEGKTITREDFLRMVEVTVAQQTEAQDDRQWTLQDNGLADDGRAGDGVFGLALGRTLTEGEHRIRVAVNGKTFQRQKQQAVRVYASPLAVDKQAVPERDGWNLTLTPTLDWVDPASLRIGARLELPDGGARQLTATEAAAQQWSIGLAGLAPNQQYKLLMEVAGATADGRPFHVQLAPMPLSAPQTAAPSQAEPAAEPEPAAAPEPQPQPAPETEEEPADDGINWVFVAAVVVVGNIALFGIIAIIVYLLRQRRKPLPTVSDADNGEAPEEPAAEAAAN